MGFELKQKTKRTRSFSSCLRCGDDGDDVSGQPPVGLMRCSSAWIRRESTEIRDRCTEIRDRCRVLVTKISRRRRRSAGGFSYDPISYALNFDDGNVDVDDGSSEFRCRDFLSRLPPSPSVAVAAASG